MKVCVPGTHLSSQTKFWEGLVAALERGDLLTHPDFATREQRIANYRALWVEMGKTFATRPRDEWAARLEARDVHFAPVLNVEEVPEDPQVRHLGTFYKVEHPTEGEVPGAYPPLLIDEDRCADSESLDASPNAGDLGRFGPPHPSWRGSQIYALPSSPSTPTAAPTNRWSGSTSAR